MRSTLLITLLVAALIGGLASRLPAGAPPAIDMKAFLAPLQKDPVVRGAHPASCTKRGCGCGPLGLSPKDKRVETNQRQEIIADWRAQEAENIRQYIARPR